MKKFKTSWFQLILVGLGVQIYQKKARSKRGRGKLFRGQKVIDLAQNRKNEVSQQLNTPHYLSWYQTAQICTMIMEKIFWIIMTIFGLLKI